MKTRIISGIIMAVAVAAILAAGKLFSGYIITVFVCLLAAAAAYELIKNAAGIKSKTAVAVSCVYTFLAAMSVEKSIPKVLLENCSCAKVDILGNLTYILTTLYFIFAVIMILKNHADFDLGRIVMFCAMPLIVAYAFAALSAIIGHDRGVYYLLLLLNFSSICDMGAYFTGVTIGKHKLCPEISPKKTVEGAVGGIISSIVIGLVIMFCFGATEHIIATALITIPLCILGMLGDLFASAIKRSVGLKDYSNLIPGHGGILDRVDSILLIAPLLNILITYGVI